MHQLEIAPRSKTNHGVQKYAVTRLQQASDEDISLYSLQLVQALKYEDWQFIDQKGISCS